MLKIRQLKKYKYPEPNNNQIFELDFVCERGNAHFKCGHIVTDLVFEDMIDLETGYAGWELINLNNKTMNKLSKTKSFSVSKETIEVNFQGTICECANLLKSGIVNQTIILVAYNEKWHEINVLNLGADDSNLKGFKNYVETMKLSLVDLQIISEEKKTDYSLKHEDFIALAEEFPFDYISISKLNDFEILNVNRTGLHHLRSVLEYIKSKKISINEYIEESKLNKLKIIMEAKKEEPIVKLEIGPDNQTAIPVERIEVHDAEILGSEKPLSVAVPAKKPISIQVFETLTPDRISELQGLHEKQLEIAKQNPVVKKITDKTSYELAKKTAATLLKASTAIDGKDGIETTATKYLNTFKNMLKKALEPIAKVTRDPYDEQKQIISAWENAELLREQAEQRAKLEKIQKRTNELFAVPFTFNGSIYGIGTVYCTPSQIETITDEEFNIILEKGKAIKQALEAEKLAQSAKDAEIEALKKQIAALTGLSNISNTEPEIAPTAKQEPVAVNNATPVNNNSTASNPQPSPAAVSAPTYKLPSKENVLLNRLDLENAEHLEKPAYIKCRSYYARGLKDVALMIDSIMTNPDVTVKKSVKITELVEILKKSE